MHAHIHPHNTHTRPVHRHARRPRVLLGKTSKRTAFPMQFVLPSLVTTKHANWEREAQAKKQLPRGNYCACVAATPRTVSHYPVRGFLVRPRSSTPSFRFPASDGVASLPNSVARLLPYQLAWPPSPRPFQAPQTSPGPEVRARIQAPKEVEWALKRRVSAFLGVKQQQRREIRIVFPWLLSTRPPIHHHLVAEKGNRSICHPPQPQCHLHNHLSDTRPVERAKGPCRCK
ncbi:hypothetical protein B0J13DRAFT_226719 [Dactylonectria estremocensis]|uniref:Uncharacterized protein n=1 Tax=Dactylonectria estremocensis TaxID=1079267 RepID=A0A9P9F8M6_9HYPO|nr:hypothetical protein B0J13DRAFT_226719 [Dactylonectria estremocensis]